MLPLLEREERGTFHVLQNQHETLAGDAGSIELHQIPAACHLDQANIPKCSRESSQLTETEVWIALYFNILLDLSSENILKGKNASDQLILKHLESLLVMVEMSQHCHFLHQKLGITQLTSNRAASLQIPTHCPMETAAACHSCRIKCHNTKSMPSKQAEVNHASVRKKPFGYW